MASVICSSSGLKLTLTRSWAWCLPTGFSSPLTYFYPVYFTVLLLHRRYRDDEACREKYGKDWDKVCCKELPVQCGADAR